MFVKSDKNESNFNFKTVSIIILSDIKVDIISGQKHGFHSLSISDALAKQVM